MTREELIMHWAEDIIPAVFIAEEKVRDEIKRTTASLDMNDANDRLTAGHLMCRIIAEKIVSELSDEQLSNL